MPLLPEIESFLKGGPLIPPGKTLEEARKIIISRVAQIPRRDIKVGKIENITIPGPEPNQLLPIRVYSPLVPQDGASTLGVTVYYHGGGWALLDLDSYDSICRELSVNSNSIVFSVDYRLSPESKFPKATLDCYAALKWVHENASKFGGDGNRIAVAGDSAGGNLSASVAIRTVEEHGPKLKAQLLISPITQVHQTLNPAPTVSYKENATGYGLDAQLMGLYFSLYLNGPEDYNNVYASPLLYENVSKLPPSYILTAEYDPLREDGFSFAEKLKKSGVETVYVPGPGLIHGYAIMTATSTASAAILDNAGLWLKSKLA